MYFLQCWRFSIELVRWPYEHLGAKKASWKCRSFRLSDAMMESMIVLPSDSKKKERTEQKRSYFDIEVSADLLGPGKILN